MAIINEKNRITGAGLIFMYRGNVLFVRTRLGNKLWGPPKGQRKENETHWKCMLREVNEETGYDLSGLIFEERTPSMIVHYRTGCNYLFYIVQNDIIRIPEKKSIKSLNEVSSSKWFPISGGFEDKNLFQMITRQCIKTLERKWISRYIHTKIEIDVSVPVIRKNPRIQARSCSNEMKTVQKKETNMFNLLNIDIEV